MRIAPRAPHHPAWGRRATMCAWRLLQRPSRINIAISAASLAADLAIEILSPGTARNDRGRKRRLLARHRVKEYWLVEADASVVEVYHLASNRFAPPRIAREAELIESALLPELRLRPSELLPTNAH